MWYRDESIPKWLKFIDMQIMILYEAKGYMMVYCTLAQRCIGDFDG